MNTYRQAVVTYLRAGIVHDLDILHSKPRIEGTRVGVLQVVTLDAAGMGHDEIAEELDISVDAVAAALGYAEDYPAELEQHREKRANRSADSR